MVAKRKLEPGALEKRIGFNPKALEMYNQGRADSTTPIEETSNEGQREKRIGFDPESVAILQAQMEDRRKARKERKRQEIGNPGNDWRKMYWPQLSFARTVPGMRVGKPFNEMRKRNYLNKLHQRVMNIRDLEELEDELVKAIQILDSFGLLQKSPNSALNNFEPMRRKKDMETLPTDNFEAEDDLDNDDDDDDDDDDYQWSEYDSWGFDRKKKGLGSIV